MPVHRSQLFVGVGKNSMSWDNVQRAQFNDPIFVIERHSMSNASATIMKNTLGKKAYPVGRFTKTAGGTPKSYDYQCLLDSRVSERIFWKDLNSKQPRNIFFNSSKFARSH